MCSAKCGKSPQFAAIHIAAAMIIGCNIIVAWNFKHLVNIKTIDGVCMISLLNNLNPVDIYTPQVLLEKGTDNG